MIDLCIDARMAMCSGIGTCIRHLVPFFNQPPFRIILLVNQLDQEWCKNMEQVLFPAPIYSIKEQLAFPVKIPRSDLFWSPHYNIPLLPIRTKKRIVTIHDACHLALGHLLSCPERTYARFVMKRALHHSDAVVTDSEFSKNELIRFLGSPQKTIHVIHPAVDSARFQKVTDTNKLLHLQKKYFLPSQFVLFVGNLKPHKNIHGLLSAFENISPDIHLVIVGKRKELRNSLQEPNQKKIFFLEQVPDEDLSGLYSLAKMLILPSFYEGFGLPPLEAMSCGCPTIVSNAASLPEVCQDASLYIQPENPQEIAKAVEKLIQEPLFSFQLIQKGFERIKHFNWQKTAEGYLELFQQVLI